MVRREHAVIAREVDPWCRHQGGQGCSACAWPSWRGSRRCSCFSTQLAPPWTHPACNPPGLRRTRIGQLVPPGQVPAVSGAGARWARSVDVAGAGALAAVRSVGCAGNGGLGERAVGVLQEAHVGTATSERSELPLSCSGACRGLRHPHGQPRQGQGKFVLPAWSSRW